MEEKVKWILACIGSAVVSGALVGGVVWTMKKEKAAKANPFMWDYYLRNLSVTGNGTDNKLMEDEDRLTKLKESISNNDTDITTNFSAFKSWVNNEMIQRENNWEKYGNWKDTEIAKLYVRINNYALM